ncbi:MAG: hypothetical protein ACXVBE_06430 [Bdellovibrionota bacterium]
MLSILLLVASIFAPQAAHANENSTYLDQALAEENARALPVKTRLPAEELFRRTQIVLDALAVPAERDYQDELSAFRFSTLPSQYQTMLKALDPSQQAKRFFDLENGSLQSYEDRDSKKLPEYRFGGKAELSQKKLSMQGLRIALDPGHMGGDVWDKRTGKYAQTRSGQVLSEGVINLQTSLLVEQKLKALGAEVLVTHRGLGPVSKVPYEKMDLSYYGKVELRARSLEDWFQNLLSATSENKLGSTFKNTSAVKKLFSEQARGDYYAKREDLIARADMIAAFKPDLTIVIHFDADTLAPTAKMPNITRAYVPGSYDKTEFASGESRARFLSHLGQGEQWYESVRLAQLIVNQISTNLNVTKPKTDLIGTTPLFPGVFARDLALTRQINESPIAYLECLSYGNDAEFSRLSKKDGGTLLIDGKQMPYSSRLEDLSAAIVQGVVKFVDSSGGQSANAAAPNLL